MVRETTKEGKTCKKLRKTKDPKKATAHKSDNTTRWNEQKKNDIAQEGRLRRYW